MRLNNFEKHIKKTLGSVEEEVDIQVLMDAVYAAPKKSSRKGLVFFSIIGVLSLISVGLYFTTINSTTGLDVSSNGNETKLVEQPQNILLSNHDLTSLEEKVSTKNSVFTLNDKTTNEFQIDNENFNIISSNKEVDMGSFGSLEQTSNTNSKPISKEGFSNSNKENINIKINDLLQNRSIYLDYAKEDVTVINDNGLHDEILDQNLISQAHSVSFLNLAILECENVNEKEQICKNIFLPNKIDCPKFGGNPWEFEIGIATGLSKPNKSLHQKNDNNKLAYTSRATNEKSLEGLDLEFFISAKRARWPVFIRSGLNFSHWTERMKIDEKYTSIDTVLGIISTTVSQSGDTITYIYGDVYIEKDIQIKKSVHYRLSRFDIPLSIVYEKEFENSSIQAEVGARMNVGTFAFGNIYNAPNNTNPEFSSVRDKRFFKRITGLSYFGKIHYRYYLSYSKFIGSSMYYNIIPSDFSSIDNGVSQNYSNIGLNVYVGMRF